MAVAISIPQIAKKLKSLDLSSYDLVVGIASGGIVPASLVAYEAEVELRIIQVNFRGKDNQVKYPEPRLLKDFVLDKKYKNILLVDDVSVSGKTLATAKENIDCDNISSLVLKGKADIVMFENIGECISLPWRDI